MSQPKNTNADLESLAKQELLREAKRGAERSSTMGPQGWLRPKVASVNKRFLLRTLGSASMDRRRSEGRTNSQAKSYLRHWISQTTVRKRRRSMDHDLRRQEETESGSERESEQSGSERESKQSEQPGLERESKHSRSKTESNESGPKEKSKQSGLKGEKNEIHISRIQKDSTKRRR